MFANLLPFAESFVSSFDGAKNIRRIDDGRSVDDQTARELRHLPDRLLRDIGFSRNG